MPTPRDQLRQDNERSLSLIIGLVGVGRKYKDLKAFVCSDVAQSIFARKGRSGRIFLHQLAVLDSTASVGEQDNARRILTNRYTLADFNRVIRALGGRMHEQALPKAKVMRSPVFRPKPVRPSVPRPSEPPPVSVPTPNRTSVAPKRAPRAGAEKQPPCLDANKLCVRAAWLVAAYVFFSSLGLQFEAVQRPESQGLSARSASASYVVP